ncbi:MAG: Sjogren's syndrome/scleroderma autoantigen 1 family protein [Candidatus Geothermarchaeota archaeon]
METDSKMSHEIDEKITETLARYIKSGWKLTSLSCPACGTILVEKEGAYYCPRCNKRVLVARDEEEALNLVKFITINELERRILERMDAILREGYLDEHVTVLSQYLDLLIKVEKLKSKASKGRLR